LLRRSDRTLPFQDPAPAQLDQSLARPFAHRIRSLREVNESAEALIAPS
jgi:hypothetical protein